ncbi:MAG: hypothetical protein AAGD11_01740 [Planctomycetota bacterium]
MNTRVPKLVTGGCFLLVAVGAFDAERVAAQLFGDVTTLVSLPNVSNAYEGNSATGNTITRVVQYRNTSSLPFVVEGIRAVHSLDPEDLGFPDLTPDNLQDIRRATLAMFPNTDILNATGWVFLDPPRKEWTTEILPFNALPLVVEPGEVFQYARISTNNTFGPDFGPKASGSMTISEINTIGEISMAIELDWRIIPEPTTSALGIIGLLSLLSARRP